MSPLPRSNFGPTTADRNPASCVRSLPGTLVCLALTAILFSGCGEADKKAPTAGGAKPSGAGADKGTPDKGVADKGATDKGVTDKGATDKGATDKAKPETAGTGSTEGKAAGNGKAANGAAANGADEGGPVALDPALPEYTPAVGVSGTIKSVGSDTMNNLMTLWAEGFQKFYPAVKIEIEGKGTATAMPALVAGTSTFGPMSREPKQDEIDLFEKKFGYKPTVIATSIDMLAVYVHKDNPLKELSLPQVDAIFSSTRKLGHESDIATWGDAGLEGAWKGAPISLYGRNSASGTYGYFKEHALGKGDFKNGVKEMPGSASVVDAVGSDKFAIGYSGIGYKTSDVRAVPLARKDEGKVFAAEPKFGYSGDYPLSRPLLLALNYEPNSELDPLRREFLKYMLSKQGQEVVVKDGYLPLTAEMARKVAEQLGLKQD